AVLQQLRDGAARVLDRPRRRDHGAARRDVAVSLRAARAARAAPARRGAGGGVLVVALHPGVSRGPAHRGRARRRRRTGLRGADRVARGVDWAYRFAWTRGLRKYGAVGG